MLTSRKKTQPSSSHVLRVPLPQTQTQHHLLHTVISFLLLNRNQSPAMLDELQARCMEFELMCKQGQTARRRPPAAVRRVQKVLHAVHQQLQAVDALVQAGESIMKAVILLGPSPVRAKEAYIVTFSDQMQQLAPQQSNTTADQQRQASKILVRTLLASYPSIPAWDKVLGPTKLHLLVQRPLNAGPAVLASAPGLCAVCFNPKQQLTRVFSKIATVVCINLCGPPASTERAAAPSKPPFTARRHMKEDHTQQEVAAARQVNLSGSSGSDSSDETGEAAAVGRPSAALESLSTATEALSLHKKHHHGLHSNTNHRPPPDTASSTPQAALLRQLCDSKHNDSNVPLDHNWQQLQSHPPSDHSRPLLISHHPPPHTARASDTAAQATANAHQAVPGRALGQRSSLLSRVKRQPSNAHVSRGAARLIAKDNRPTQAAAAVGSSHDHNPRSAPQQTPLTTTAAGQQQEQPNGVAAADWMAVPEGWAWWCCSVSVQGLRVQAPAGI